jgi:hypothetical protein
VRLQEVDRARLLKLKQMHERLLVQSYVCKHTRFFFRAGLSDHTRLWIHRKTLLKGLVPTRCARSLATGNRVCRSMHARMLAPRPKVTPHQFVLAATTKCPAGKRGSEGGIEAGRMRSQNRRGQRQGASPPSANVRRINKFKVLETQQFTLSSISDLARQIVL